MVEKKYCNAIIGNITKDGELETKQCNRLVSEDEEMCGTHKQYYESFTDEQMLQIKNWHDVNKAGDVKFCKRLRHFVFCENSEDRILSKCKSCKQDGYADYREKTKPKKLSKKCNWFDKYGDPCRNFYIDDTSYCTNHQYVCEYTSDQKKKENCGSCSSCHLWVYFGGYKTCAKCRSRGKRTTTSDITDVSKNKQNSSDDKKSADCAKSEAISQSKPQPKPEVKRYITMKNTKLDKYSKLIDELSDTIDLDKDVIHTNKQDKDSSNAMTDGAVIASNESTNDDAKVKTTSNKPKSTKKLKKDIVQKTCIAILCKVNGTDFKFKVCDCRIAKEDKKSITCLNHRYYEKDYDEDKRNQIVNWTIDKNNPGNVRYCNGCKRYSFDSNSAKPIIGRCSHCIIHVKNHLAIKKRKIMENKCEWYSIYGNPCIYQRTYGPYCETHVFVNNYTDEQKANSKHCSRCQSYMFLGEFISCNDCIEKEKEYRKLNPIRKCKWFNKYGQPCRRTYTDSTSLYCKGHQYVSTYTEEQKKYENCFTCPIRRIWVYKDKDGKCGRCQKSHDKIPKSDIDGIQSMPDKKHITKSIKFNKKCEWFNMIGNPCNHDEHGTMKYCIKHSYVCNYTDEQREFGRCSACSMCRRWKYIEKYKVCEDCRKAQQDKANLPKEKPVKCKLDECRYNASKHGLYTDYCGLHQHYALKSEIEAEIKLNDNKVCSRYIHGCRNIIIPQPGRHQKQCNQCILMHKYPDNYIDYFKKYAAYINIPFELDNEYTMKLVSERCFYCDGMELKGINGLDRLDCNGIYIKTNVVPACWMCNRMKLNHDINDFVKYCHNIIDNYGKHIKYSSSKHDMRTKHAYTTYRNFTLKNRTNIRFSLTKEEYAEILTYNCYYCQGTNRNDQIGIDRIQPDKEYINYNCVACCSICNYMKYTHTIDIFLNKINEIIMHNKITLFKIGTNNNEMLVNYFNSMKKNPCNGYYKDDTTHRRCINFRAGNSEYCVKHEYFKQLSTTDPDKLNNCGKCGTYYDEQTNYCKKCTVYQRVYSITRIISKQCIALHSTDVSRTCNRTVYPDTSFCKYHVYLDSYTDEQLTQLTKCKRCKRLLYKPGDNACNDCMAKQLINYQLHGEQWLATKRLKWNEKKTGKHKTTIK